MKLKNIVFLPASPELRDDLFKLGKDFILVKVEGKSQFMVITNQAGLIQDLAMKHNITSFYTSDNKRSLFRITKEGNGHFSSFMPSKLGLLKRTEKPVDGKAFLIVTEENSTYYYEVENITC